MAGMLTEVLVTVGVGLMRVFHGLHGNEQSVDKVQAK
jgi:hypothetical protein